MQAVWTDDQLIETWTLLDGDRVLLSNKSGSTRLGFAVLLKFFEVEARFPLSAAEVPSEAVRFVAAQLGVAAEEFARYDWSGRTVKYHRAQIRESFGFREPSEADEALLAAWLAREVCPFEMREAPLREALLASRLTVNLGELVVAGQQIMLSGNTGHSSGPHLHLHLGIRIDGVDYCPQPLLVAVALVERPFNDRPIRDWLRLVASWPAVCQHHARSYAAAPPSSTNAGAAWSPSCWISPSTTPLDGTLRRWRGIHHRWALLLSASCCALRRTAGLGPTRHHHTPG
jgi:hypothetical protein